MGLVTVFETIFRMTIRTCAELLKLPVTTQAERASLILVSALFQLSSRLYCCEKKAGENAQDGLESPHSVRVLISFRPNERICPVENLLCLQQTTTWRSELIRVVKMLRTAIRTSLQGQKRLCSASRPFHSLKTKIQPPRCLVVATPQACFRRTLSDAPYPDGRSVVITAAGPDRDGVVHDVSLEIDLVGGSIEESRMCMLGNQFVVMMLATLPHDGNPDNLAKNIQSKLPGFYVGLKPSGTKKPHKKQSRIMQITARGPDQPGVVKSLTELFVHFGMSVRDLNTSTYAAPFAGYTIFAVHSVVSIPTSVDMGELEASLKKFEERFGYDVEMEVPDMEEYHGLQWHKKSRFISIGRVSYLFGPPLPTQVLRNLMHYPDLSKWYCTERKGEVGDQEDQTACGCSVPLRFRCEVCNLKGGQMQPDSGYCYNVPVISTSQDCSGTKRADSSASVEFHIFLGLLYHCSAISCDIVKTQVLRNLMHYPDLSKWRSQWTTAFAMLLVEYQQPGRPPLTGALDSPLHDVSTQVH
eukprot:g3697.t1